MARTHTLVRVHTCSHAPYAQCPGPPSPLCLPQSLDASWKAKVEALLGELQREKGAAKDAAGRAAGQQEEASARVRTLEAGLAATEQQMQANAAEATRCVGT